MGAAGDDDDEYVCDIIISFLLASHDAVASCLTSFFLLLAKHPRVAVRMRVEIPNAIGEPNAMGEGDEAAANYEHMREMALVEMKVVRVARGL